MASHQTLLVTKEGAPYTALHGNVSTAAGGEATAHSPRGLPPDSEDTCLRLHTLYCDARYSVQRKFHIFAATSQPQTAGFCNTKMHSRMSVTCRELADGATKSSRVAQTRLDRPPGRFYDPVYPKSQIISPVALQCRHRHHRKRSCYRWRWQTGKGSIKARARKKMRYITRTPCLETIIRVRASYA